MPEVTKYQQGSFCWVELMTTDQAGAKNFYTKLFGWTFEDSPMGDGTFYTMLKLNGKTVGALYQRNKEQQNIPAHWNSYVAVNNADDVAKKAQSIGGKTILPPFDVFDVGRMTVIEDPTGAKLSLWQAKKHTGASVVNEPGAMCWHELGTSNEQAAGKFYTQLFGWGTKSMPLTPPYTVFSNSGSDIGGMYRLTDQMKGMPSHWLPYFNVADCDAAAQKAKSLGGSIHIPPTDIPNTGRFAYVQDPFGAVFAIIKLNPR
ncbi:MAG TPA: VOC family protein [Bacteroidota bacterium]|nr:VOC family protein [Bacteroidota bacterium]